MPRKAHLSVSLLSTAYGAGTRQTVSSCEDRKFKGLEFSEILTVPQIVAINNLASYGVWWDRIRGVADRQIQLALPNHKCTPREQPTPAHQSVAHHLI